MRVSKLTGTWGEALAAEYLRKKRYRIIASGYHCRFGEIDLIAENRKYVVFVELKTRKNSDFAKAFESVDFRKQERIRTTASMYLAQNPTRLQPRFDVIEILTRKNRPMEVLELDFLKGAYEVEGYASV